MRGGAYVLLIPANTRLGTTILPVASIIPSLDLQLEPWDAVLDIEVYTVGEPSLYYNARGATLLRAYRRRIKPIYNDLIITSVGCTPLSREEARQMQKYMMNHRN